MDGLLALILAASCTCVLAVTSPSCVDGNLTVHEGQPFIINFGFRGVPLPIPTYTKDGSEFTADRHRTFTRVARIFFARVIASDDGIYQYNVGNRFQSTICVTG